MRLLLDTHVALWWMFDPDRLSDEVREALGDEENAVFLSAVSVWEAVIKEGAQRLSTPGRLEDAAAEQGMEELRVAWRHARRVAALPSLHRDPFDRLLVAQALEEGLVLATRDPLVRQYPVTTVVA
jgi:PIN domain nuclease of toxin-antitoxin system